MKQRSLSETRFDRRPKATKRQRFLSEMDAVIPWARLMVLVDPVQPKRSGKGGRKAFSAETMLRIHFMQQWFALSDPAMEEALHDVLVMRQFAGLDAGDDLIPDESTWRCRSVADRGQRRAGRTRLDAQSRNDC